MEGQLRKNEKLLESLRENITEVRLQIAAAKGEYVVSFERILLVSAHHLKIWQ